MIGRLCGVAIDARASTRTRDPVELARATRWIAGNLLAIRRHRPIQFVRVESLTDLLSAIAVGPVLVDRASLPLRLRRTLRRHLPLLDFLFHAVASHHAWLPR